MLFNYIRIGRQLYDHNASMRSSNEDQVNDGDLWEMEVDLRSDDKEKRTVHWFVRGNQQKGFFKGLPEQVEIAVLHLYLFLLILSTYSLQVSVASYSYSGVTMEFVRLEELSAPTVHSIPGEQGYDW